MLDRFEENRVGANWLIGEVKQLTTEIHHETPVEYNERVRYLPESVSPNAPGYISYDVTPFLEEIIECADPQSPVREVNLKKGVQVGYTTLLESILLYYMGKIRTRPSMFISAEKGLVKERIENYIIPMLIHSEMGHIIQSSDIGNSRKTGKTADHMQWVGGGFMIPAGANNAHLMRSWTIQLMLKDEIDAWPDIVGKDGDPDALTDDRCSNVWELRKIFRGSTPLIKGLSKIQYQFERGDQRKYHVRCRKCDFPQELRWERINKETGQVTGFQWEYTEEGHLDHQSVRYLCANCGYPHAETDKMKLFAKECGAEWVPTAKPVEPDIRSYHLPAFYSPAIFQPWYKCVSSYLEGFDPATKKVTNMGKYQRFYNNILGEPFEIQGSKVMKEQVYLHRRTSYKYGEVPGKYAVEHAGGRILFLVCTVDLHKGNLAVSIWGVTPQMRMFLIDYWRFEDSDCTQITSPVWSQLTDILEQKTYTADNGDQFRIMLTLVDANYSNDTVTSYCAKYASGVYPILGREKAAKNQRIEEFAEYSTKLGTIGSRLLVDHYKDRMAPVLRREWTEAKGIQPAFHFNAPMDITNAQIDELCAEVRVKKADERGRVFYAWHRPGNKPNELWDLFGYAYAATEIIAYIVCIQIFEVEEMNWVDFWRYAGEPENDEFFARVTNVEQPGLADSETDSHTNAD